ncbi:MAG TPA: PBP1A family penicillin-binding protein [Candidatus Limnocylindrales bacterium]|nr:PBP1A family penicillin-binding protein [Candidatus Limnocylindrales bacterium]
MAIKVKIPRVKGFRGGLKNPFLRAAVAAFLIVSVVMFGIFSYYYIKYQKIVDKRFYGPIFANTAKIYAQPRSIRVGQKADPKEIANYLRHAGYTEAGEKGKSKFGTYNLISGGIEIKPGEESYYNAEGAVVRVSQGKVDRIASLSDSGDGLSAYELEPQLVTGLFDSQQRSKRRLVKYDDIPKVMVDAVISIEDRRFFHHGGVNYGRLVQAALIDLKEGGNRQGGSTITMQVARGFFLSPEKKFKRKLIEILISIELEQRFSKKQIFELYANQVDMGQRGSFTITGFGEAANAYFGKDLKDVTLPEAALLAGLVQRPSYLSPYRHPERAMERRNLVLEAMVETGDITRAQADAAKATPLKLAPQNVEASDAPYFVDLIREQLVSKYGEDELNHEGYRVYTTIDPELQKAAAEAVDVSIKEVDQQINKLRTRRVRVGKKWETKVMPGPMPQVALVALDPHTGEVLALVGGRNYGYSQLNHAVAKRPTGSIFKPFVYATAINNAITNEQPVFTPATLVDDSPTAFINGDDVYTPRNYQEEYHGQVTAQFALAHSLNNATVKVAEMVGYDKVADLARLAGISSVKPTPAMALGSYDATPLEMASAYTVFTNAGQRITPIMIKSVRDPNGDVVDNYQPQKNQVLDPRVAYVMTAMLEGVLNSGTAVGVRARGFTAPAAGKTGSSRDAWFAGYTSNLLCVVWVGYDDYSDIKLTGAVLALPVWTEFMKRAVNLPEYSDVAPFTPPQGVVELTLDKATNQIATASCPDDYQTAFIDGTQPTQTCDQTAASHGNFFQKLFGMEPKPVPPVSNTNTGPVQPQNAGQAQVVTQSPAQKPEEDKNKKKGFWGRLFGGDKKDDNNKDKKPAANGPGDRPQ